MIECLTRNVAFPCFLEDEIGGLGIGEQADFSLLDQNILEIDPAEAHNATVMLTNLEGSEVDRSQAYAEDARRGARRCARVRVGAAAVSFSGILQR